MINVHNAKSYCCEDISKIENYDKAIADKENIWHCHHRAEICYSKKELIENGDYFKVPACNLIFLTKNEHARLHYLYGKSTPDNTGKSIGKGRKLSEEHKNKIKTSATGKKHSIESNQKTSNTMKGHKVSEETKRKMAEKRKLYWEKKKAKLL